jgi:histidinol-phosphatase (PHP family)
MIDYHIHTSFSLDSDQDLLEVCKTAIKNGLKYIAITDHIDIDDSIPKDKWIIEDIHGESGYIKSITKAQELFPELHISRGVETGYTPSGYDDTVKMVNEIKPDFSIGSIHFMEGYDLYDEYYYIGKTKNKAFKGYLERIYESIEPLSKYANVIGHRLYMQKSKYPI